MEKRSLKDVFLFPRKLYSKLSDRVFTLYLGIMLIGLVNCLDLLTGGFQKIFWGKSAGDQFFNVSLFLTLILLLGLMDAVFFGMPIFDYFNKLKKKNIENKNALLIKFIKVYSIAHIPVAVVYVLAVMLHEGLSLNFNIQLISWVELAFFLFVVPAWFCAILTRGARVLFELEEKYKPIMFLMIFSWYFLVSIAIQYIREQWLFKLFL